MVEENPYCYSIEKHRQRLEEEVDIKRCVEEIQKQKEGQK